MDINKAQNLLYKINNLFQSIQMSENKISALEKDLMKNYIMEFYESFVHDSPNASPSVQSSTKNINDSSFDHQFDHSMQEAKQLLMESELLVKKDSPTDSGPNNLTPKAPEIKTESKPAEKIEKESTSSIEPELTQEPHKENQSDLTASIETAATPSEEVENRISPDPEPVQSFKVDQTLEQPLRTTNREVFNLDPKMEELFMAPVVQDLSDRLSSSPIQDLGKAFGVNERILTINELFGGDIQLFNNTIQSLNRMDRFEDAKKYLVSHVAKSNQWVDDEKKSKAATFIKTVRRKFQS